MGLFNRKAKAKKQAMLNALDSLCKNRVQLCIEEAKDSQVVTFIIDQLHNKELELLSLSPEPLKHNQRLVTLATLPNAFHNIKFQSRIKKKIAGTLDVYFFSMPKEITCINQRETQRTSISICHQHQVLITDANSVPIQGLLRDISTQGLKAEFKGDRRENIKPSIIQRLCNLELIEGSLLEISLEIIYVSYNKKQDITTIGCKFQYVDEKIHELIFQFISTLQKRHFHQHL